MKKIASLFAVFLLQFLWIGEALAHDPSVYDPLKDQPIWDKNQHFMITRLEFTKYKNQAWGRVRLFGRFKRERELNETRVSGITLYWQPGLNLQSAEVVSLAGGHPTVSEEVYFRQFNRPEDQQLDLLNGIEFDLSEVGVVERNLLNNLTYKLFYSIGYNTSTGRVIYRYGEVDYGDCMKHYERDIEGLECRAKFDEEERMMGYEAYISGVKAEEVVEVEEYQKLEEEIEARKISLIKMEQELAKEKEKNKKLEQKLVDEEARFKQRLDMERLKFKQQLGLEREKFKQQLKAEKEKYQLLEKNLTKLEKRSERETMSGIKKGEKLMREIIEGEKERAGLAKELKGEKRKIERIEKELGKSKELSKERGREMSGLRSFSKKMEDKLNKTELAMMQLKTDFSVMKKAGFDVDKRERTKNGDKGSGREGGYRAGASSDRVMVPELGGKKENLLPVYLLIGLGGVGMVGWMWFVVKKGGKM